ncbi:MAG: bifunctional serine/threonine-protein kinase/formylglycine-generating enzyme family protein [Bacteroidetes bacterium]|nr:bifunctional serine/threonine-protein kinase/formylglycine-generating enzyme family protein [Bacteroidota bacterium]
MLRLETNTILNNRYRLERRIGSGGFSVVWKADDEKAGGMPVAIKIFMPDKGLDDSLISMFRDEFELTSLFDDNRLVKMTDYFVADESPCLVMPYMPGGSLYQKLQQENELPEREIARILYQVCGALNYLHTQEKPALHLDIKPENILIDYSGNYLLADFGISLKMRSSLIRASNTKGGTFAYSPPEMSESRKLSPASDIFSLGVMLFELCTGALPWSGMGGNAAVIGMPMPDLSETYSRRLQEIMHSCMERYPQNRPTARQLEEVARKFLDRGFWDTIAKHGTGDEPPPAPSSAENLQKAIAAGEIADFVKRHKSQPTAQHRDQLFYDLNKRYGNISRDRFDAALEEAIKIKGRETQPIPQSQLQPESQSKPEIPAAKKNNPTPWIIVAMVVVIGVLAAILWPRNPSAYEMEIKRLADSIRVADSTAASQAKIMVFVQGGTFNMGTSDGEYAERPVHSVTIGDFYIGKYEVTQIQWRAVMGYNPSNYSGCDDCPVENVSWNDVQEFIQKLNQKTGKSYRLPTEAEWEYAAKGGDKSNGYTYSGSNSVGDVAWYSENSGSKTHPVGQKQPNELGLYDMSGNVWEWCSDWYDDYQGSPTSNPKGPSSGYRHVGRGGSGILFSSFCRPEYRINNAPDNRDISLGFRLAFVP